MHAELRKENASREIFPCVPIKENDAVAPDLACGDLIDRSLVERSHQYLRKHQAHPLLASLRVGQWFADIIVQGRPMKIFRETLYGVR